MWLAMLMVAALLAACGGDGGTDDPTPTALPMPTRGLPSPTAAASPVASPAGSPAGSLAASPIASAGASPVSQLSGASTLTRDEFKRQLAVAYPMETAGNEGGQVILGGSGDISTTNPLLASDATSLNVLGQVFEPLLGASPIDGRPVPALADSWDVSPDGLVYTFHLNTAATWHDGVDVTAEDVAFSFDAILDPNLSSVYRSQVRDVVSSYRVVDADTFEITATDRFVSFLYNAPGSVFIVPKHVWGEIGYERWSFDAGSTGQDVSRVVGTGPFTFREWRQGERVTLAKNAGYYDVVPHIDEFVLLVQAESDVAVRTLEAGDIDIIEILPAPQTAQIQGNPELRVDVYDLNGITFYMSNLDPARNPALADVRVRQAMYQAFDRELITNEIFLGFGEQAIGTQPPPSLAYAAEELTPYPYDPAAAQRLLAEAGWSDTNGDGTVDRDGSELEMTMVYTGGDQTVDSMASYLQESWSEVGVKGRARAVRRRPRRPPRERRLRSGPARVHLLPRGQPGRPLHLRCDRDRLQLRRLLQPRGGPPR
jgi:peptide/nickel transport system substrate-binding protein